jgi:hypothetical protein
MHGNFLVSKFLSNFLIGNEPFPRAVQNFRKHVGSGSGSNEPNLYEALTLRTRKVKKTKLFCKSSLKMASPRIFMSAKHMIMAIPPFPLPLSFLCATGRGFARFLQGGLDGGSREKGERGKVKRAGRILALVLLGWGVEGLMHLVLKGVSVQPPPSPGWAEFTIVMELMYARKWPYFLLSRLLVDPDPQNRVFFI